MGCGAFTSTVTDGAESIACTLLIDRLTSVVPFWAANWFGSTLTVITAGVTPEEGERVTPVVAARPAKDVTRDPGSTIDLHDEEGGEQ